MKNNQNIPEGWSVKKLGEVFDTTTDYVAAGSFADLRDKVNYLDIPSFAQLVRTVDIKNNFNNDGFVYINQSAYDFLWRVHLDEESIILPNIGANIGEVYFLSPGKLPYSKSALGPNAILLRSSKENLFYLYCFCQTACFRNLLDLIVGASGQPKFNKTDLKTIEILLPPLSEQEKIAEILGTWDEAIEKLSALIEQKKLLKKGLMQRLLTGKTRLNGFTQPWKEVKLGEIAKKISDKNNENCSNIVTISAQNGFVNQDDYFNKFVSSDTLTNYYLLQKGDFGYNRSYSRGYPLGAIKKLNNHEKAVVSTLYICFRSLKDKINSIFLEQYFETGLLNKDLSKVAQEGARNHGLLNITLKDFFSVKLYIPTDIAEQKAIADVLSAADEEIDLLNKKLKALKEQKKGLMQQLLTGQTRVKVN